MAYGKLIGKCVVENNPGSIFRNTRLGQELLLPPVEKSRFTKHYQQGIQQPSRKVLVLEVSCCFFLMILKSTGKSRDPSSFKRCRTSLVVQWIRIRLLVHGTHVRSLVREDSTCRGATKPSAAQLLSLRAAATEAHVRRACAPQQEKSLQ